MPDQPQPIEYDVTKPASIKRAWNWFSRLPKKYRFLAAAALIAAITVVAWAAVQPSSLPSTLKIDPPAATLDIQTPQTVKVILDAGANTIGSVEVSVQYDSSTLELVDCYSASNCPGVNINASFTQGGLLEVSPSTGILRMVVGAPPPGVTGVIDVATMAFTPLVTAVNGTEVFITSESSVMTLSDSPVDTLVNRESGVYTILGENATCSEYGGFICAASAECQGSIIGGASDVTPPQVCCSESCREALWKIENVSHAQTGPASARITFHTIRNGLDRDAASCTVYYGPLSGNLVPGDYDGSKSAVRQAIGFYYADLTVLTAPRYYYMVSCVTPPEDGSRTVKSDEEFSFVLEEAKEPLLISGIAAINIKSTSADITWQSNKNADSYVVYDTASHISGTCPIGTARNCLGYASTGANASQAQVHKIALTGLVPNTKYYFRASSETSGTEAERAYSQEKSFFTTAGTLEADANVILKVQGDRTCSEWLTCSSSAQIRNKSSQVEEELCYEVGLCRKINPKTGACVQPIINPGAATDYKIVYGDSESSTVDAIRNRSGYFNPNFTWEGSSTLAGNTGTVYGWQHIGDMSQIGEKINVPNGDFEIDEFGVYPWQEFPNSATTTLSLAVSSFKGNDNNRVLQISGEVKSCPGCGFRNVGGVVLPLGGGLQSGDEYAVSFDYNIIPEEGASPLGDESLIVRLYHGQKPTFMSSQKEVNLAGRYNAWKHGLFRLPVDEQAPLEQSWLAILYAAKSGPDSAYRLKIDNVQIDSVLELRSGAFAEKSCRLYANNTAAACDFLDNNTGREIKGWKGFCLERDPKRPESCLMWWPVDVVKGESVMFSSDKISGYADRFPLYYCLESSGNQKLNESTYGGGYQVWTNYKRNIYKTGCKKKAPSDLNYTFAHCAGTPMSGEWDATGSENQIYEYDIDRVHVKAVWNWNSQYKSDFVFTKKKVEEGATEEFNNKTYIYERLTDMSIPRSPQGTTAPIVWRAVLAENKNRPPDDVSQANYIYIYLKFDESGKFIGYFVDGVDSTSGNASESGGKAEGAAYRVIFYLRETCNYVAQTVTPFGDNKAWTDRFSSKIWEKKDHNELDYPYDFEKAQGPLRSGRVTSPYGAMIQERGFPDQWTRPATVEPPDELNFPNFPNQARAGAPYSVKNRGEFYACTSGNIGKVCSEPGPIGDEECRIEGTPPGVNPFCNPKTFRCEFGAPISPITPSPNVCWDTNDDGIYDNMTLNVDAECGGGICMDWYGLLNNGLYFDDTVECSECFLDSNCVPVASSPGNCELVPQTVNGIGQSYCINGSDDKIGQLCDTSSDCGLNISGSAGKCVGVSLTDEQTMAIGGGVSKGVERLKYLFAKSYGVWKLVRDVTRDASGKVIDESYKYKRVFDSTSPGESCSDIGMVADPVTGECGWDITGEINQENGKYYATRPVVKNLRLDSDRRNIRPQTVYGGGYGIVVLLFNSSVDDNQLPLIRYTVEWGDGSVSNASNLRIFDRDDEESPHALVHTYICEGENDPNFDDTSSSCNFKPKVQIEDNWGWCSGTGTDAYSGDGTRCNSWDTYTGEIIIVPPEGTPPPPPPPPPQAPTITNFIATPSIGESPLLVTFTATIDDPDNAYPVTVEIDYENDGTFDDTATVIPGDQDVTFTHTYTAPASVTAVIRATDTDNLTATQNTAVTITPPPPPQAPTITNFIATPSIGESPLLVTFTATIDDPDNAYPVTVEIDYENDGTFDDTATVIPGDQDVTFTHTYTVVDTYTAVIRATDADNKTSTQNTSVTVSANTPPSVTLFNAQRQVSGLLDFLFNYTVEDGSVPPDNLTIEIDYDYDGTTFTVDDSLANQSSPHTGTFTHTYATAGTYQAALRVRDAKGAESAISEVTVLADWWDMAWRYRRKLALDNTGRGQLDNFPLMIKLLNIPVNYSGMQADGSDLRFVDNDGTTVLAHEIESLATDGYVWVKVPQIDANSNNTDFIWVYYGNSTATDSQDPAAVWSNGYVAVWHLGEERADIGNPALYKDSTGNNLDGDDEVFAAGKTGKIGLGQEFANNSVVNDVISVPDNVLLDITGNLTLEGWVYLTEFKNFGRIIAKPHTSDVTPYDMYALLLGNNNNIRFGVDIFGTRRLDGNANTISVNQWQHIVGVRNNRTLAIYINGALDSSTTMPSSGPISTNNRPVILGKNINDRRYQQIIGFMDELRISNVARSAAWIGAQYSSMNNTMVDWAAAAQEDRDAPIVFGGSGTGLAEAVETRVAGARIKRKSLPFFNPFRPIVDAWKYILEL